MGPILLPPSANSVRFTNVVDVVIAETPSSALIFKWAKLAIVVDVDIAVAPVELISFQHKFRNVSPVNIGDVAWALQPVSNTEFQPRLNCCSLDILEEFAMETAPPPSIWLYERNSVIDVFVSDGWVCAQWLGHRVACDAQGGGI